MKNIDKLLHVFYEGGKHVEQKFIEIDESYYDSDDYRTLVTFLQKACSESGLFDNLAASAVPFQPRPYGRR